MATQATAEEGGNETGTMLLIRAKIVHALEIFPFLSVSAIHQQIGTSLPRDLWQPILQELVSSGEVSVTEVGARTPLDRNQTYTIYHLAQRTLQRRHLSPSSAAANRLI
jgi:hypothetical protein